MLNKPSTETKYFIPFAFHKFSNCDCHLIFKKLVDMKKDGVILVVAPKTNEKYISETYGSIR